MRNNKRRIDACLRACAGISTQNLEDNVPVIELARRYNVVLRERDALRTDKATLQQMTYSLKDRLEAAEKERDELLAGLDEWLDKTKWVQQGVNEGAISAKYIGLHRADVMTSLLGEAEKERDELRAKIAEMEQQNRYQRLAAPTTIMQTDSHCTYPSCESTIGCRGVCHQEAKP